MPDTRRKETLGVIPRLGLDILAQPECHRPAIGRVRQHRHCLRQSLKQLLWPGDPVEIAGNRAQAVICRDGAVGEALDLLQHRVRRAGGEDITRKQQHRQAVHMRQRRGSGKVGRAGPDRGGHRHHPAALLLLGIGDGDMRHRLLVMAAICRQLVTHAVQCLAEAGDIAMAEDGPYSGKGRLDAAVKLLDALRGHPAGQRL